MVFKEYQSIVISLLCNLRKRYIPLSHFIGFVISSFQKIEKFFFRFRISGPHRKLKLKINFCDLYDIRLKSYTILKSLLPETHEKEQFGLVRGLFGRRPSYYFVESCQCFCLQIQVLGKALRSLIGRTASQIFAQPTRCFLRRKRISASLIIINYIYNKFIYFERNRIQFANCQILNKRQLAIFPV